jgi:F-type H+-transporting ATPase subunit a
MNELPIALEPYVLGEIGGLPITSTLLTSWVVMALIIGWAVWVRARLRRVPVSSGQVVAEVVVGGVYDYIAEWLESRSLARKLLPIVLTLFLYITLANLIGLLPGVGSVGFWEEAHGEHSLIPLLYPMNTDLNVTLALALIAFVVIEYFGFRTLGLSYVKKFVNLRSVTGFFVGIIEAVSELARIVSFSFRLFGNIFAGKVLLLVLMALVPFFIPAPMMGFEAFVGIIQGAIFALLTLFFVKIAISEHSEKH